MTIDIQSPCKINLILNILGKRPDGFHELESVMHPVGLYDQIQIRRGGSGSGSGSGSPGLQLTCSDPALPTDADNLVYRAAAAFQQTAGIQDGVRIHLEKRIPMAAGLGGGSGNAATTLLGLNELFGHPLAPKQLVTIAASLGSDVPFFLQPRPALATGRGEQVVSLDFFPAFRGLHLILVHPGFGISTPWAYKQLAQYPHALNGHPGRAQALVEALRQDDLTSAVPQFYNSLEAPALDKYPLLQLFQEFFRNEGAITSLMSGSGSSTFALVRGETAAQELLEKFRTHFGATIWTAQVPLGPGDEG